MKSFRPALFAASLCLVPLAAQEPEAAPAPSIPKAAEAQSAAKTAEQWIQELGSDSYRKRLEAERALRQLGAAALPALKKAATGSEDAEVQWRAARVQRQIEGDGRQGLVERDRRGSAQQEEPLIIPRAMAPRRQPGSQDPMRDHFESLFEQFERDFGIDIPRARFFGDGFFRDLQEQMKSGTGRSQGMSVQIGPDGAVHVEVQERNEKGEIEKKSYDAPDMESFRREHPGVLQQNGLGFGLSPWRGNARVFSGPIEPGWSLDMDALQPRIVPFDGGRASLPPQADAPAPGRRLGITIRPEIAPDVRAYLELKDGIGLMVDGVQDESLAKAVGLQRGDIVVEIAGQKIGGPQDVQVALAPIEQGKPVEVKFLRKGQLQAASAAKIEAAAPFEAKGRLEKRGKGESTIR